MDTQEREKAIYNYFEQQTLNGGITTVDFRKYLKDHPEVNTDEDGRVIISQPDARFRKIVGEFSDILSKRKEGKRNRYFLDSYSCRESLYHRHIGFNNYISNHLEEKGFCISYKNLNSDEFRTVVFYPEYKRIYNNNFYIYGVAYDRQGLKFDIVNDCVNNKLLFTQLNVNLITQIKELDGKDFVKTFANQEEWDKHFEYVLGVDPIPNREPIELMLYVKKEFKNRFAKQPLAKFIISETSSDKQGYTSVTLKIKHNRELERTLLSYGNDILVKSPEKIRKIVAKEIKKLNEFYNN